MQRKKGGLNLTKQTLIIWRCLLRGDSNSVTKENDFQKFAL